MARAEDQDVALAAEGYRETVAEYLARAREEYGQDLRSVSDALRIRFVYLQAIEEGRYRDLPGSTYAVGFVRTYADYLGLDSEEVVRRFKEEMGGLDRRQRLVFPVPKPEGRVPGGAIILISLLLLALAYGGWYALQSDRNFMDMISGGGDEAEVGEEMVEAPAEEPAAPAAEESAPAPAEEPTAAPQPEPAPETETGAPEAPSPEAAAPEVPVAEAPAEAVPEAPLEAVEVAPAPGTVAEGEETLPPLEEDEASAVESETEGAQEQMSEEAAAALPAAPAAAPQESTASGDVFGAPAEEPVRIVIEATNDSWVQVFDQNAQLLIARVLRTGDRYRVPQQEGLSMLTGNAGGLEVRVDGSVVPSLGPFGQVVRNISLDPVLLLNGTAVGAASNPQ